MMFKYLIFNVLVFAVIVSGIPTNEKSSLDWKAHTSKYGETCVNHDQCVDFRMICSKVTSVCECDQFIRIENMCTYLSYGVCRFHDWTEFDPYRSECVLNTHRLRTFLSSQEETKPNYKDNLSEEAHNLFVYLGLAGIVAISIGVLLTLTCVVFVFTNDLKSHDLPNK